MNGLVVIPCGAAKRTVRSPARDLYTGSYFRGCRRAAEALRPSLGWLILSAKHGLVLPSTELDPYNLKLGEPGSVTAAHVRTQAAQLGLTDASPVVILAGKRYVDLARQVWPRADAPLQRVQGRGMGHHLAYLARLARSEGRP